MYSWLVTVLFLASAAYSSGGARVPITSYICTQPNLPGFKDLSQCSVSSGLRTCETKEGGSPTLLDGDSMLANELYGWNGNTNPFVVLDIPQGWCVGSVVMTFQANIPALSLSVHSSERLSTNTDRTMFSIVSEEWSKPVVVNFTTLACGRYLRINMTSARVLYLTEIEVSDTGYEVPPMPVSTPPGTITAGVNSLTHLMPTSVPRDPPTHNAVSTDMGCSAGVSSAGENSLTHPMPTSFPRDSHTHNAGSTDMGCSAGISSAVFFAGLLAGAALAGPVGALSVACYHWKKKKAKTRGKNSTIAEDREMAFDYPIQLEKNPAYEVVWK